MLPAPLGPPAELKTNRPYVKLATGLVKDTQTTTIDTKTVTILADPGAKLDRDGDGPILVVQSSGAAGTNVQIFDLEITGATGTQEETASASQQMPEPLHSNLST